MAKTDITFKKKKSFTNVANEAIRDDRLSPEAKGVYAIIQSWITFEADGFVCSRSFIFKKSNCGEKKFDRIWSELKQAGYLKMYCVGKANWTADLLDSPQPDTPHTYYMNSEGKVTHTNIDIAEKKAANLAAAEAAEDEPAEEEGPSDDEGVRYPQKGGTLEDELRYPQKRGTLERGALERGSLERGALKQGDNINTPSNHSFNNTFNNHSLNNQSIYPTTEEDIKRAPAKVEDRLIDRDLIERVKNQIDYEVNVRNNPFDVETINHIVNALCELHVRSTPKQFGEIWYDAQAIRDRAAAFNPLHVEYILECLEKTANKPHNIKAYMLATVFSAPVTYGTWSDREHAAYIASYNSDDVPEPSPYVGAKDDIMRGWGLDPNIYGELLKPANR